MSTRVSVRHQPISPKPPFARQSTKNLNCSNSLGKQSRHDQYSSDLIDVSVPFENVGSSSTLSVVSTARLHPYNQSQRPRPRVTRNPAHFPTTRPEVFGPHTLLVGLKVSDHLAADSDLSKPPPYPTAPAPSAYALDGSLVHGKEAEEALELAKASHLAIRAHETMLQAKIREELVILRILTRQAENFAKAAVDAQRQIGEIYGMMRDQDTFHHQEKEENGDGCSDDDEVPASSPVELNVVDPGDSTNVGVGGKG